MTVTMGIVSATKKSELGVLEEGGYENFIQTDAAINRGNSGGALLDAKGRLLGISSAIIFPNKRKYRHWLSHTSQHGEEGLRRSGQRRWS